MGFCVFGVCMMLLEPVGLDSCNVIISFARWRHFITACGSNWRYPWAVRGLEQGLTILFSFYNAWHIKKWNIHTLHRSSNQTVSEVSSLVINVWSYFECDYDT